MKRKKGGKRWGQEKKVRNEGKRGREVKNEERKGMEDGQTEEEEEGKEEWENERR